MSFLDDEDMSEELSAAAVRAADAHRHLAETPADSAQYQAAMNAYLQATVLYMSIVSVAQARQYEVLSAEVMELRAMLARHDEERPAVIH